jgi:hypothetical protein
LGGLGGQHRLCGPHGDTQGAAGKAVTSGE